MILYQVRSFELEGAENRFLHSHFTFIHVIVNICNRKQEMEDWKDIGDFVPHEKFCFVEVTKRFGSVHQKLVLYNFELWKLQTILYSILKIFLSNYG